MRLDAHHNCAALRIARRIQRRTIAAINAHRVPGVMQEPLASAVTRIATQIRCHP